MSLAVVRREDLFSNFHRLLLSNNAFGFNAQSGWASCVPKEGHKVAQRVT